jgi:2-C-methyl-D-erythritol 4-phosphate cytidylyltransferase
VTTKSVWAVVPAAGIGSRMQADCPKQYLHLGRYTILEHTLRRLSSHPNVAGLVVAIAEHDTFWPKLTLNLSCPLHVVDGGNERVDSVQNALQFLKDHTDDNPWVMVHDAARPLLRHSDIDVMLEQLYDDDTGGILGVAVTDTVKRVTENNQITETVCREGLWRAGTPQMFRLQALSNAITKASPHIKVTDEASAMEYIGMMPKMVAGHSDNIKVTVPQDLALASLFLQQQREEQG